jgi:hypothetical protein
LLTVLDILKNALENCEAENVGNVQDALVDLREGLGRIIERATIRKDGECSERVFSHESESLSKGA